MTDQQPGSVVCSALDQVKVQIDVDRYENQVAGTPTMVSVITLNAKWTARFCGPQVVLIDETGAIEASPVEWTLAEFNTLREATDCERGPSGPLNKLVGRTFQSIRRALLRPDDRRESRSHS